MGVGPSRQNREKYQSQCSKDNLQQEHDINVKALNTMHCTTTPTNARRYIDTEMHNKIKTSKVEFAGDIP
jgi:hypothetical protein